MFDIITIVIAVVVGIWLLYAYSRPKKKTVSEMPESWKKILDKHVEFYRSLTDFQKIHFQERCMRFLSETEIVGVDCNIAAVDKIFLAASATIPIFAFPDWHYSNLNLIQVYPGPFNLDFKTKNGYKNINGLVGTGFMEDKMFISQKALRHGFLLESDKRNTALHEFIHLIDMMDGEVDGIPKILMDQKHMMPWVMMMDHTMGEMMEKPIDIREYGATNRMEFFAVLAEYFFERPRLLEKNHPELYKMLLKMFHQDPKEKVKG